MINALDSSSIEVQYTSTPFGLDVGGIYTLSLNDDSTMVYKGGGLGSLRLSDDAKASLEGGSILHISSYQYVPKPNGIGYPNITIDCRLDSVGYDSQTNVVKGLWKNGDPFSIQLHNQTGYDPVIENIQFVPEPVTLLLVGSGVLGVRRVGKIKIR
jgi:hypothetical protein